MNLLYPLEGGRILFLLNRDGLEATIKFCEQTFKVYKASLKTKYGRVPRYRLSLIKSRLEFRKFLRSSKTPAVII